MKPLTKLLGPILLLWIACTSANAQVQQRKPGNEEVARIIVKQKQEEAISLPVGVSQDWYQQSVEEIQKSEYFIKPIDQSFGYTAANSEHHLGFLFTPNGYSVKNMTEDENDKPWQVDFQFKGISRYGHHAGEHQLINTRNQQNILEF